MKLVNLTSFNFSNPSVKFHVKSISKIPLTILRFYIIISLLMGVAGKRLAQRDNVSPPFDGDENNRVLWDGRLFSFNLSDYVQN